MTSIAIKRCSPCYSRSHKRICCSTIVAADIGAGIIPATSGMLGYGCRVAAHINTNIAVDVTCCTGVGMAACTTYVCVGKMLGVRTGDR